MTKPRKYIGIDTGTNTGVAIWNTISKAFDLIATVSITEAMRIVLKEDKSIIFLRIEDARLRKWFGKSGREKLQGAGSIKRDAVIWEKWCEEEGIKFELVAPKNNRTKVNSTVFSKMTGYSKRTSEHARDAAMLVLEW